jgi:hypothetical protein
MLTTAKMTIMMKTARMTTRMTAMMITTRMTTTPTISTFLPSRSSLSRMDPVHPHAATTKDVGVSVLVLSTTARALSALTVVVLAMVASQTPTTPTHPLDPPVTR